MGVIVGVEYVTLFTALVNQWGSYGWEYRVDFHFGAPFEEVLQCNEADSVVRFIEEDLLKKVATASRVQAA